ncbi:MAG: lysylphosphatidylglycerol synthase transmembrane domain-containing protein [Nannocystales bacterium]
MSSTARRVLRVVGSVGLLAAVVWWVDVGAVLDTLSEARLAPLGVALVVSVPLALLLAARWCFTARRMGIDLPLGVAAREYYVSMLINRVVPGGVVGDVGRAVQSGRRNPEARGAAARSVVLERVSGQVSLWLVVLGGLVVWGAETGARLALIVLAVLASAAVLVALFVRIPAVARGRIGRWWSVGTAEAREAFVHRGAWATQLGLSLLSVGVLVVMYAGCVEAVGATLGLSQLVFIAPTLLALTTLPLSVGGWGVREAASAVLFEVAGLDPSAGVAASAAFGAVNLVAALPGAWFWARRAATPGLARDEPAEP